MEQSMKIKTLAVVLGASLLVPLPASHAADMVVKVSKTTSLAAEENVSITLEKFPAKAGVYLVQCQEAAPATRPANCNAQTQLWISDMRGASFAPTAAITMKLVAKFDNVDCTVVKCGLFVRYDHTAGSDTSEDQFIPITFAPITTTVTPTTPTKTIEKQSAAALPTTVKVGKSLALPIQTAQGSTITYRSTTSKICTVKGNVLRAVKAGKCGVQAFAPGSDKYENFTATYSLTLKR